MEIGYSARLPGSWGVRFHAVEIGGVIRAPAPSPACDLRIRTKWPRSGYAARGIGSALVLRGDDLFGGDAFLDPTFQSSAHVVLRVALGHACAEAVGTGAASAVLHAGYHEQANERGAVFGAHFGDHALEVVDGTLRWNRPIAPTMVKNELPTAFFVTIE